MRYAILASLILALAGCKSDAPLIEPPLEPPPPCLDVEVSVSINGGGPVLADLIHFDEQTGEISIPEDVTIVEFTSFTPCAASDSNMVHLQGYSVTWRRMDGGTSVGTWPLAPYNFSAATAALVPAGSSVETGILIAPAGMKTQGPFMEALVNGQELLLIADIDFIGQVGVGPTEEIHVYASVSVNFADFSDQ